VKLEWENPTGSMKDRMAQTVISRAEEDGRLKPGDTVVEYTGGSTGTSLALVCAAKGYRIRIVTSDAFSAEKRDHMMALGAEAVFVGSGIFKSSDPAARARAIVRATTHHSDPKAVAEASRGLGEPMRGLDVATIAPADRLQSRGW